MKREEITKKSNIEKWWVIKPTIIFNDIVLPWKRKTRWMPWMKKENDKRKEKVKQNNSGSSTNMHKSHFIWRQLQVVYLSSP